MDEHHYARALRAIGQDLANLYPEYLEIEQQGEQFIARGRSRAARLERKIDETNAPLLQKLWQSVRQRSAKPAPPAPQAVTGPFLRRYTPSDINRLDGLGFTRRTDRVTTPDIHTLGETLRTIGRIVDEQRGQLIKLTRDPHIVRFEYRDSRGETREEEVSNLELYRVQRQYYAGRGAARLSDLWVGRE